MAFQVSPGVNVTEIDLTTVVPAVSSTEGAIAGVFTTGPVEDPVLISSETELVARFGKPTDDNFETFFTAANFLSYGNKLWVSRAISTDARNAYANVSGTVTATLIKNYDEFLASTTLDADADYYARNPGTIGNSLKISVCDSAAAYSSNVTLADSIVTAVPGSNVLRCSNGITVGELGQINTGDLLKIGGQFLKVVSKSSITGANATITVDTTFTGVANVVVDDSLPRYWEFYNNVNAAPGTSDYAAERGGVADELHVAVVDEEGTISGTAGTILEIYQSLSRATDAKGPQGGSAYFKEVINDSSQYIYVNDAYANVTAAAVASTGATAPVNLSFVGGVETTSTESTIPNSALQSAWDKFKNPEEIDVSLLMIGKSVGSTLANYVIDNIAETRKDCVVFISPERSDVVNAVDQAEKVVEFRNTLRSTSYAVLDSGYKYQYDRYNDVNRYIPLNGDIAGLCVRTDETRDPWFSPAGFNRGQVKNILKLAYNPDKADRDLLYKNGANPVVTFPGQGTVLYGDKTLLSKPSAFDRINVRRLFIVLEKAIATAAKFSLFEFNDEFTRAQFRALVEPYLRDVQGRRGVYDFKVICDKTNNTGEVIDRNEFVGDIYIKPARSINFIQLNFVAVRTGVEFSEVIGQF
jgi:phage tail sheath protein FI